MQRILAGIDDTDNKTSRGTGFLARKMAGEIESLGLGLVNGISRHQLFFDPRIPYTSQNSSACLDIQTENPSKLENFMGNFLLKNSAEGSDAGLSFSPFEKIGEDVLEWGFRAKKEVLTKEEAYQLAESNSIFLKGYTGTLDGIIGALAAIGLRKSGNDGRFIWLKGREIRDLSGVYRVDDLLQGVEVDQVVDVSGGTVLGSDRIEVGDWVRPVIIKNRITIFADRFNSKEYEWKVAGKEFIKSISG